MENDKENSRKWIIEASAIVFRTLKYDDVSVTDIIEKAGVSRRTFYNNFSSKSELVEELLIVGFENEGIDIILSEDTLDGALRCLIDELYKHKLIVTNLHSEKTFEAMAKLFHRLMQLFVDKYEEEINMVGLTKNIEYLEYIINVSSALFDTLVKRGFKESEEEVYFLITTILNIHKK